MPKECSTRDAMMPRPPAESLRETMYARSSKTRRSASRFRSTAGLIVRVITNPQCYPEWLRKHPQFRAYLALAAVCVFWGTTYLAIRIALESFSPAVLVFLRFTASGTILLAAAFATRAHLPSGHELLLTAVYGLLILGIGNGALAFAEVWIPSGLAAMFITISPFWMVGIEAALPGGQRLHWPTIAGMLVGLAGTLILVAPSAITNGFGGPVLKAFIVLQIGCCGWALGSILQRRLETRALAVVSGAIQQLATGIVFMIPAFLLPHAASRWTARGIFAVAYLVIFGSIVGYSAYIYALQHLPVSVVSLYNYINPAVAVVLGFIAFREPFGPRELIAMLIIFTGVALVKRFSAGSIRQKQSVQRPDSGGVQRRHTTV